MKKSFYVFFLAVLMSGCATGYQWQDLTGRYSEIKLQEDIFKVIFLGNAYGRPRKAEDLTLLRCAELVLENKCRYFILIDEKSGITSTPPPVVVTRSDGKKYTYPKPSTSNTIKCFREKPRNFPGAVYDAEQVRNNIRSKYGLNK